MIKRAISEGEVRTVLKTGAVIEDYPADLPYPSCLIFGWSGTRPIHVVIADNANADESIVITAYEPDTARWYPDFRTRRRP
jgi:hypothetical protein